MDTLSYLGKNWISKLELTGRLFLPVGIALGFIFEAFGVFELSVVIFVSLIVSATTESICYFSFYRTVNCPGCHKNLNRFKNGKNIPIKQAYNYLQKGGGCRSCDWKPSCT